MKVLMIEPGKAPYEAELDGSLKSMQEAVGGGIEGYLPPGSQGGRAQRVPDARLDLPAERLKCPE